MDCFPKSACAFALIALMMGLDTKAACAEDPHDLYDFSRITVMEENDYFASHDDRHYTQGARISLVPGQVTPDGSGNKPFDWLQSALPIFGGAERTREYEWTVGQSIFTPQNVLSATPTQKDRPYAAWLYVGAGMLQETKYPQFHTLENFEILGGVVGPAALGGITQNTFHQFINESTSVGWENQLHNEPGFIVSYERKWRFQQPLIGNFALDAIPEAGVSGGNVLTYGDVGGIVRIGQNLAADYGPDRIRPSLSGTSWFDPSQLDGKFGWYLFAGAQGRAVGHNIFLDGNTVSSSPSVDKRVLVADFIGGVSVFWSSAVRADFTVTQRTKEFYGPLATQDKFGGINVVAQF